MMERKGDGVPSNPSNAPKNDQTPAPTPTLDQDKDDDKATVELLLIDIHALRIETEEMLRQLDDAFKNLHRSEAEHRSLRATCHGLEEEEVKIMKVRKEMQQVVKALEETMTRMEMEQDASVSRATARDLKVSWVVATVASALAVAVYLHTVRKR